MMSTRFSNGFENFIWFILVRPKRYPKQNLVKSSFCDLTKMLYSLATGHRGSQGNKSNRVDRVFQANEATQLSCNVTNDGCANPDHCNGADKAKVPIEKT